MQRLAAILLLAFSPGCMAVQVGTTNPIPDLTRVAVAPFLNLSQEVSVDSHRFALAYFSELQKVPGFQVVPVGIVETAMRQYDLNLGDPDDVLTLAKVLNVDAVAVGAVTDYDPYYPPRIGLHVAWYSPKSWTFYPGIPLAPEAGFEECEECAPEGGLLNKFTSVTSQRGRVYSANMILRAQSPVEDDNWKAMPVVGSARVSSPGFDSQAELPSNFVGDENNRLQNDSLFGSESESSGDLDVGTSPVEDADEYFSSFAQSVNRAPATEVRQRTETASAELGPVPTRQRPGYMPGDKMRGQMQDQMQMQDKMQMMPDQMQMPDKMQMMPGDQMPGKMPGQMPSMHGDQMPSQMPGQMPLMPGQMHGNQMHDDQMQGGQMPSAAEMSAPKMDLRATQPMPRFVEMPTPDFDPRKPLMSYTRIFDGADANLVANLRDYVELSGDRRSGGWEAYLHRSDDFIRFTAHLMILEMLTVHGGEAQHRFVFKMRKYK